MTTISRWFGAALVLAASAGCGDGQGKVKGRVVENGQPFQVQAQAALMLTPLGPDGSADPAKSFAANLNGDGTFQVVVSEGSMPPGTYKVSLVVNAPEGDTGIARYKRLLSDDASTIKREIKAGKNDLTIDLAKPSG